MMEWFKTLSGVFTLSAFAVGAFALAFRETVRSWAQAQGKLGAEKSLETHRSDLQREVARLSANLQKELADHSIWVSERHKATSALASAFNRAYHGAIDFDVMTDDEVPRQRTKRELLAYVHGVRVIAWDGYFDSILYLSEPLIHATADVFQSVDDMVDAIRRLPSSTPTQSDLQTLRKDLEKAVASLSLSLDRFMDVARADVQIAASEQKRLTVSILSMASSPSSE